MPERDLFEQLDQAIEQMLFGAAPAVIGDRELAPLAELAGALRHLPSESFRDRLKAELERKAMKTQSTSTTAGFRAVTPFLIHAEAPALVDFLKTTFEAEELKRKTAAEFYSELRIGDSMIMIAGGTAAQWGNLPAALHVYVDDCDAAYRRALAAGAVTLGPGGEPTDQSYGERSASVRDAFGNYWYIATSLSPEPASEDRGSVLPYLHPASARNYMDFLKKAFGAEETAFYEYGGRVMHATARIGDAVVEMGEPMQREGLPLNGQFLFVDDVDGVFQRALDAGGTAIRPPADEPYGMRSAIVKDPAGFFWWPARRL